MKKLLTLGLGALLAMGVSACGSSVDENKVFAREDDHSYLLLGQWSGWGDVSTEFQLKPTSIAEVKKIDQNLGKKLAKKKIKYLYSGKLSFQDDATWEATALVNGEVKSFNGNHAIKAGEAHKVDGVWAIDHWMPNPADTDAQHMESLTDNLFMPTYQKEKDAHGFAWDSNPVITDEAGSFDVVLAVYTTPSSATKVGLGMGVVKAAA